MEIQHVIHRYQRSWNGSRTRTQQIDGFPSGVVADVEGPELLNVRRVAGNEKHRCAQQVRSIKTPVDGQAVPSSAHNIDDVPGGTVAHVVRIQLITGRGRVTTEQEHIADDEVDADRTHGLAFNPHRTVLKSVTVQRSRRGSPTSSPEVQRRSMKLTDTLVPSDRHHSSTRRCAPDIVDGAVDEPCGAVGKAVAVQVRTRVP